MALLSVLDISLETANKFYTWGWKLSLVGAAVTLAGVGFLMWGTRVRDHDFETTVAATKVSAAQANERAATLTKQAAELELQLERERTERLKLDAEIAPRRLTHEQHEAIAAQLAPFAGQVVRVASYSRDIEAAMLSKQLLDTLRSAGFTAHNTIGSLTPLGGYFTVGIQVTGVHQELVNALKKSLSETGKLVVEPPGGIPPPPHPIQSDVVIVVGEKPLSR